METKFKPYIMLIPAMLVFIGIFVVALSHGFMQSLGYFPAVGLKEFTLRYYKEVFLDENFLSSLLFSFSIAFKSSLYSVIVGVLLAYSILASKHKKGIEEIIYKLPIIVPHTVAALLVFTFLSQSGILARVLYTVGIISGPSDFPALIFDRKGRGIIFAYIWKGIPFITLVVYSVLSNINDKLKDVAMNLSANRWQVFRYVQLPLIMPSILSSFIIIFAFSFGAFEVPYLLGPTTPRALPVQAYIEYINPDWSNRPYTMTINMILTGLSFIFIWIYHMTFKIISKYNGGLR